MGEPASAQSSPQVAGGMSGLEPVEQAQGFPARRFIPAGQRLDPQQGRAALVPDRRRLGPITPIISANGSAIRVGGSSSTAGPPQPPRQPADQEGRAIAPSDQRQSPPRLALSPIRVALPQEVLRPGVGDRDHHGEVTDPLGGSLRLIEDGEGLGIPPSGQDPPAGHQRQHGIEPGRPFLSQYRVGVAQAPAQSPRSSRSLARAAEDRGVQAVQVVGGAEGQGAIDQLLGLGVPRQFIGDDRGQAAQSSSGGVDQAGIRARLGGSPPSTSRPWRSPRASRAVSPVIAGVQGDLVLAQLLRQLSSPFGRGRRLGEGIPPEMELGLGDMGHGQRLARGQAGEHLQCPVGRLPHLVTRPVHQAS